MHEKRRNKAKNYALFCVCAHFCFFINTANINIDIKPAISSVKGKFSHIPLRPIGSRANKNKTGKMNAEDTEISVAQPAFPIDEQKLCVASEIQRVK